MGIRTSVGELMGMNTESRQEDVRYLYTDAIEPYYEVQQDYARDISNDAIKKEEPLAISTLEAGTPNAEYDKQRNERLSMTQAELDQYIDNIVNAKIENILAANPAYKLGNSLQRAADKGKDVLTFAASVPGVIAHGAVALGTKVRDAAVDSINEMKASVKDTFDKIGDAYAHKKEQFKEVCHNLVTEGMETIDRISGKFHTFADKCKAEYKGLVNDYHNEKLAKLVQKAEKAQAKQEAYAAKHNIEMDEKG